MVFIAGGDLSHQSHTDPTDAKGRLWIRKTQPFKEITSGKDVFLPRIRRWATSCSSRISALTLTHVKDCNLASLDSLGISHLPPRGAVALLFKSLHVLPNSWVRFVELDRR